MEAVNWCAAMTDPSCDVSVCVCSCHPLMMMQLCVCVTRIINTFQVNGRRKAMQLAFQKHNKLMAEAQEGQGGSTLHT